MKEKFLIFIALFVLIVVLVGLNLASYVQQEKLPDTEIAPNRSTYNVGSTGTRAFYDLLYETGRNVMRWQEPPSALLKYDINSPATFVIIGKTQLEFEESEISDLMKWVRDGGRLVFIDRGPDEIKNGLAKEFLETKSEWKVVYEEGMEPNLFVDPSNQKSMTEAVVAAKPAQPTIFTENIIAIQPSIFASSIGITWEFAESKTVNTKQADGTAKIIKQAPVIDTNEDSEEYDPPPPTRRIGVITKKGDSDDPFATPTPMEIVPMATPTPERVEKTYQITAPVVHLASEGRNLLVEFPYGQGHMVFLTDPYIVSNGGINLVDNAQIGINLLTEYDGIIAFDEYHQGYGRNNNLLLAYFEGTPFVAFLLQLFVLVGLIFYSQSRRFARALPVDEPDRLSKLEYVSAMAQLQQRTKSFDLAVENIYKDFRRRASRLVGVDSFTVSRADLAKLIAERIGSSGDETDKLMFKCEDIIHGEPTNKKEVISLIARLREIENDLGLRRK